MVKRGQAVRRPIKGHKASTVRKRAPAEIDASKGNSRLKDELAEAREQQAATSELLKVIGRSALDLLFVSNDCLWRKAAIRRKADFSYAACTDMRVGVNGLDHLSPFLEGRPPPDAPMSATFAKLFSRVCLRAGDFADHFSASMLVKTTNRSAR
jgi:hypothetical protein